MGGLAPFLLPLVALALVLGDVRAQPPADTAAARAAVLATLAEETRAFCHRDLEAWRRQWVHAEFTSKLYAGDVAFEELIGWTAVDSFTRAHIRDHPDTIPIAPLRAQVDVTFLGEVAYVEYAKQVAGGIARELRLLAADAGRWRIVRTETLYRADVRN